MPSSSVNVSPSVIGPPPTATITPVACALCGVWQSALHVPHAFVLLSSQSSCEASTTPSPHTLPVRLVVLHVPSHPEHVAVPYAHRRVRRGAVVARFVERAGRRVR